VDRVEAGNGAKVIGAEDQAEENGHSAVEREAAPVKVVKSSFNLPETELDDLRRIARMRGVTATHALRQAIATLTFLNDLPRGSKVLVRESDGAQREIVFRNF
jgi:hypothetical protein